MTITPLGDQGLLVYFDLEAQALSFTAALSQQHLSWIVDVVPVYKSVGVYHDPERIQLRDAEQLLRSITVDREDLPQPTAEFPHVIPCCYELGEDLERVTHHSGLARPDIIRLHASQVYTVHAIGFCPGFPYLGYLPPELQGVPRLETPRVRVEEGSIGLTGTQTGIYTEARPGGWNLIGRTPLTLVDVATEYFPLRAGARLRFEPIDRVRFDVLKCSGARLPSQ